MCKNGSTIMHTNKNLYDSHYINLRSTHGTQKEHMEIAEECRSVFTEQFPVVSVSGSK